MAPSTELGSERLDREQLLAEGLIPDDDVREFRAQARLAELALDKEVENLEVARLERERAEAVVRQAAITAPIAGVVVDRYLSAGEILSRSGTAEVVTIAQLDPLVIEVHAPLELIGRVATGQKLNVAFQDVDLEGMDATVRVVDRIVDTASTTFRVQLELANPDYHVPAGLRCVVEFPN